MSRAPTCRVTVRVCGGRAWEEVSEVEQRQIVERMYAAFITGPARALSKELLAKE